MNSTPYLWIVFMRFPAHLEAEFNEWYDQTHIPLVTGGGHFLEIIRYRLTDAFPTELAKYVAVCKFRNEQTFKEWLVSDARAKAAQDTAATWEGKGMEFSPKGFYEPYRTYDI